MTLFFAASDMTLPDLDLHPRKSGITLLFYFVSENDLHTCFKNGSKVSKTGDGYLKLLRKFQKWLSCH